MALVVLITPILISALVVKVGTVALTMTGLDRRKAAFQAHSAFTNTGWTTRETELIMAHDQRRRIVGAMMAPSYAGFASVIASLIASLGQRGVIGIFRSLAILTVAISHRPGSLDKFPLSRRLMTSAEEGFHLPPPRPRIRNPC